MRKKISHYWVSRILGVKLPTVKIGNGELTAADYEIVSCTNNTGVGSMTITIAGKGNYGRTKSQSFKIKAKSMN